MASNGTEGGALSEESLRAAAGILATVFVDDSMELFSGNRWTEWLTEGQHAIKHV